jgi:hypothetical protein
MRMQTRAIALLADYGSKASLSQCQQPLQISQHATFSAVHRRASGGRSKEPFPSSRPQTPKAPQLSPELLFAAIKLSNISLS